MTIARTDKNQPKIARKHVVSEVIYNLIVDFLIGNNQSKMGWFVTISNAVADKGKPTKKFKNTRRKATI